MSASRPEVEVEGAVEDVEWIHFYRPMTVQIDVHRGETLDYGSELRITHEMREAGVDRAGKSWLDLLSKPEAQVERYGELAYAPGRWPAAIPKHKPGSREWLRDSDRLRTAITRTSDRYDRKQLQSEFRTSYGDYLELPIGLRT